MALAPEIIVGLVVAALIGLDKAGYYLKRKGLNGKAQQTNGAKDLATELVKQLSEQAQKQDGEDTRFIPGFSPTCVKHGEKLVELSTELPHIKTGINEIKAAQVAISQKVGRNLGAVKQMFEEIQKGIKAKNTDGENPEA